MQPPAVLPVPSDNQLLAALPRAAYQRLLPHLERVHIPQGKVLFEVGETVRHAYFPLNCVASLLSMTEEGETVEVAVVGFEGVVGVTIILRVGIAPYTCMVQIPGEGLRVRADVLRAEFGRNGQFQDLLLRYTHSLLAQVTQSAICNRFHTVDARFCRWLLMMRNRVRSDTFNLTQEFIAHMLGTPRTVVTAAANRTQDAGLIRYKRGRITVLDRVGLEAASCECFEVVLRELTDFMAA